eukprot:2150408-Amphidinium_carterae.1
MPGVIRSRAAARRTSSSGGLFTRLAAIVVLPARSGAAAAGATLMPPRLSSLQHDNASQGMCMHRVRNGGQPFYTILVSETLMCSSPSLLVIAATLEGWRPSPALDLPSP